MTLLSQNAKLKKDGIFNFTLPAYKSQIGLITCPSAKDCIANCYARQGCYQFSNVKSKHEQNLEATLSETFEVDMIQEIIERKCLIVRIHDSGDFYSKEYLDKWINIINALPHVTFYAYTKSLDLFANIELSSNFKVIQSQGGKHQIDENKPHAKVFESMDALVAAGYVDASESDLIALYDVSNKIGLVYHGTKKHNSNNFINKAA